MRHLHDCCCGRHEAVMSKSCQSGKWFYASTGWLNVDISFASLRFWLKNHEFSKGQSPSALIKSKHSSTGQYSKFAHFFLRLGTDFMREPGDDIPQNTTVALIENWEYHKNETKKEHNKGWLKNSETPPPIEVLTWTHRSRAMTSQIRLLSIISVLNL